MIINSLVRGADEMQIRFLAHQEHAKSDAFILTVRSQEGTLVYLQDGGWTQCHQLDGLLTLRRNMLLAADLADQLDNPAYKMEITLLISHFHIDHVQGLAESIIPCPYLHVRAAYCPACSCLAQNTLYPDTNNGDAEWRPRVFAALKAHQPQAKIIEVPFGEMRELPFHAGRLTVMMPEEDWGEEKLSAYAAKLYFTTRPTELRAKVGVPIVNANCLWARAEMHGKVLLLTGDTMKRSWEADDESMDRVMALYGDFLQADILKYPHHGTKRSPAWPNVQRLLKNTPGACVVLTGNQGFAESGPYLTENNVPWVDVRQGTVAFTFSADGVTRQDFPLSESICM